MLVSASAAQTDSASASDANSVEVYSRRFRSWAT